MEGEQSELQYKSTRFPAQPWQKRTFHDTNSGRCSHTIWNHGVPTGIKGTSALDNFPGVSTVSTSPIIMSCDLETGNYNVLSYLDGNAVNTCPSVAPAEVVILKSVTPVGLVMHGCLAYLEMLSIGPRRETPGLHLQPICQRRACQARGTNFPPGRPHP